MTTAILALGSNLGDRFANLQNGIVFLHGADGLNVQRVSPVIETPPVGGPEQGPYLNAVCEVTTELPAQDVLGHCQAAEQAADRVREERWGPRTLDVDIIAFGAEMSADPDLTLPHPRAHERSFVLTPWALMDADAVWPGGSGVDAGVAVGELAAAADDAYSFELFRQALVIPA